MTLGFRSKVKQFPAMAYSYFRGRWHYFFMVCVNEKRPGWTTDGVGVVRVGQLMSDRVSEWEQDKETMQDVYEVTAFLTGFTQYQDGKKVSGFDSLRIPAHKVVVNLDAFEAECIERAFYEAELKIKKAA